MFQPFGQFSEGDRSNRFQDLYTDTLWLSRELLLMDKAVIRSVNFVAGSAGFAIYYDGSVEMNDVTIRGTIEASTFQTASSGARLVIDGSSAETFITFYDSLGLLGYIGSNLTGWGPSYLAIQTPAGLDGIALDAHGLIKIIAGGASGDGILLASEAAGGTPGTILEIMDWNVPSTIATFETATGDIMIGNTINQYARRTEDIWLGAKKLRTYLWNSGGTAQLETFQASYGVLKGDDGSTGLVEFFPKNYIDVGAAQSSTISLTTTETAKLQQTIACEYANQPVTVYVSGWLRPSAATDQVYTWLRCGINGTAKGSQVPLLDGVGSPYIQMINTEWIEEVTADGSGNVTVELFAKVESGTATNWGGQITWRVERR